MTDIVERLRRFRPPYGYPEEYGTAVAKPLNEEAADEIVRLRAESEGRCKALIEKQEELRAEWTRAENAEAYIARLRSYLSEGANQTIESEQAWKKRALQSEAEITRLRALLDEAREVVRPVYDQSWMYIPLDENYDTVAGSCNVRLPMRHVRRAAAWLDKTEKKR